MSEFRKELGRRILVADGAFGTMLYARGVFINRSYDELNLSSPDLVRQIHREYADVGADILETNTYGANRLRLAGFGLGEKHDTINQAGVRLAREASEASGRKPFVAGAIGPLGARLAPIGPVSPDDARAIFREQATVLLEAGADLLILETFTDLHELRHAVIGAREAADEAARKAAGPEPVIIAQVAVDDFEELPGGVSVETFTREMNALPADVIGLNCSVGPKATLEAVEQMMAFTDKPLSAMPNAGMPTRVDGRNIYLSSPEYMAQYARRMLQAGARIVGGCCGTTPEHIRQIVSEARSLQPRHVQRQGDAATVTAGTNASVPTATAKAMSPIALAEKSQLGAKLASGKFVTFVEILPPRGTDASKEIAGARLCAGHGIDCINVPDGPRASARLSAQVTCQLIQRDAGIEAVSHFCCRDRNILGIQSELLGSYAAGVRNLICITGDPPRMGMYPDATAVFDVDAIGLVSIARNLNIGLDMGDNPIGSQTGLVIGVGANPGALNLDEEIRRFERKVKSGAEYVVTQPVFDLDLLEAFLQRVEAFKIPVICGIWPLTSYRNAEFMVNELRVPVPAAYMERMRTADSGDRARDVGVAIAQEMVQRVRHLVQGIQLSAPFGRYQMALDVASALK